MGSRRKCYKHFPAAFCDTQETGFPTAVWGYAIREVPLDRACHCRDIVTDKLVCDPTGAQALAVFVEYPASNPQTLRPGDYNISVSLYANNPDLKD